MKNYNLIKPLMFLFIITTVFTSCKKDDDVNPPINGSADILLVKVTNWNPSTGTESGGQEYIYDDAGKLKTIKYTNSSLNATYTNGKLVLLSGKTLTNADLKYTIDYNASGQVSKVTKDDSSAQFNNSTTSFTYNATGKITQTTRQSNAVAGNPPPAPTYMNYTWNGDNLATSSYTSNGELYTTNYTAYDDKINPDYLGQQILTYLYGSPASKNNVTEIKSIAPSYSVVQKRSYTYNSVGYATSMKLMDGSNEGSKYYYNK